jgi:hypothetical protein
MSKDNLKHRLASIVVSSRFADPLNTIILIIIQQGFADFESSGNIRSVNYSVNLLFINTNITLQIEKKDFLMTSILL